MMIANRPPASDALTLDDILDLKAAKPLAESLLARRGADLDVDASNVRRLGGLCLQVLLSAVATWSADGKALAFLNPAPAFVESLERLGFAHAA